MRISKLIIILLFLPAIIFGKVNFFEGSLNEAQRAAALEGKLYFIDFYASYCLPCKLMDQTTFMDADLAGYIKGNYVPLKLNIDAFDAYEVRTKHEVPALPTVMIFSSGGKLLDSYTGSLTASALRALLEKHNVAENRPKTTPPPLEAAYVDTEAKPTARRRRTAATSSPTPKPAPKKETVVVKPIAKPKPEPIPTPKPTVPKITSTNQVVTKPKEILEIPKTYSTGSETTVFKKDEKPASTFTKVIPKPTSTNTVASRNLSTPTITPEPAQQEPKSTVSGLFEFRANRHPSKGYAIQIGLFAEYSNVLTEVEKIQSLFPERKVIVHIDELNGKTVYRIAIGTFATSTAARNFITEMEAEGFQGFVKDLSTLK